MSFRIIPDDKKIKNNHKKTWKSEKKIVYWT
jgi:hypothetical protein